jgi:hypothetical protein
MIIIKPIDSIHKEHQRALLPPPTSANNNLLDLTQMIDDVVRKAQMRLDKLRRRER